MYTCIFFTSMGLMVFDSQTSVLKMPARTPRE